MCAAQLLSAELSDIEQEEVQNRTSNQPALVVFGQNNAAKAFVVNEIFNRPILPQAEDVDPTRSQSMSDSSPGAKDVLWRRVNFRYGEQTNISLCLPGSFELLDNDVERYKQPLTTVPRRDLEITSGEYEEEDLAKWTAALEVTLNDPLLQEGGGLIVAPQWTPGRHSTFMNIFHSCVEAVVPIIVYAIAHSTFTTEVGIIWLRFVG